QLLEIITETTLIQLLNKGGHNGRIGGQHHRIIQLNIESSNYRERVFIKSIYDKGIYILYTNKLLKNSNVNKKY
ncbi:MAG: hypothetical protein EAZ13_07530, partial [Sphingobacteriia bacterium]